MNGSGKCVTTAAVAALLVLLGAGCRQASSVSVSARATASGASGSALDLGDGITVSEVRIALVKVALESEQPADGAGTGAGGGMSGGTGHSSPDHLDEGTNCDQAEAGEVKVGPCLIDLTGDKLTAGSNALTPVCSADVPAGTYDELRAVVGPVVAADAAALSGLAPMDGKSVIVDGAFNGTAFSFQSTLHAAQKTETTITVGSGASSNVTLSVDPTGWFKAADGSVLDPTMASNQRAIEENIEASIRTFPDEDKDGVDDDD